MAAQVLDCGKQAVSEMNKVANDNGSVDSGLKMGSLISTACDPGSAEKEKKSFRAEIDASPPFGSVKEAVARFGGFGFWKPIYAMPSSLRGIEVVDIAKIEEQTAQLQKELRVKERETLSVLKELEANKMIVEELKLKLHEEALDVNAVLNTNSDDKNVNPAAVVAEKKRHENLAIVHQISAGGLDLCPSSAPGFILLELKQAKLNLTRTLNDLADIRATVESYTKKIEKERISLEKTRERLSSNSSKIATLEEELNQTKLKLELAKNAGVEDGINNPMDISMELQRLSSETEQFKRMGEAAKSEILIAVSEIEQTKTRIKTAEIRLVAARKMKEAARASEAVSLAEIKALSNNENSSAVLQQKTDSITLSFEEYSALTAKARQAGDVSKRRVVDAMLQVGEANVSKTEILRRVEEAAKEAKISKKTLEEALSQVESANRGKLAVEEALRKWRAERSQKRRSVHNSTKFKNSCPTHLRKNSSLVLDVNALNLIHDETKPVLRSTLSIGQTLSRKQLPMEEYENGMQAGKNNGKHSVSLGEMLSMPNGDLLYTLKGGRDGGHNHLPAKRKKFGFARISVLLRKQIKKKKKQIKFGWTI